jgi:GNAT superfamily N-acetyltransferase
MNRFETDYTVRSAQSAAAILNPKIRGLVEQGKLPDSEEFVALSSNGSEVGLISVEEIRHLHIFFIQLIFVLPEFRRLRIGTALLSKAEQLARQRGFEVIWLRPRPLDLETNKTWLVYWYDEHGYKWSDDHDHMQKIILNAG